MALDQRNIVITGFMGTGKSTVGPLVAKLLGRAFIEMDHEIEKRAGLTITEIFNQHGEAHFRELESALIHELAGRRNLVIATGGGAMVNDQNRSIMMRTAFVVCLITTPEVIEQRLADVADRPLAGGWRQLWENRQGAYDQILYKLDVTGKSPDAIANKVVELWQRESQ